MRVVHVVSAAAALSVAVASWAGSATSPVKGGGLPLSVAAASGHSHAHSHADGHGAGSTPASRAELRRLVAEGEDKLSRGDADGAHAAFDQAGLMAHQADIELGVLRSQMQAGQYRQALAFAAHTAGVHLDEVEGAVLYAWLLNLGAQVAVSERALQQAEARDPQHPAVQALRRTVQSDVMLAQGELRKSPARLAPYATGAAPLPGTRAVATGVLLADGEHALVPREALPASGPMRIWLRNGLGQTVSAHIDHGTGHADDGADHGEAASPLVMLHLSARLPVAGGDLMAPRDAFPGSPVFGLDMPADAQAQPAWPVMRAGFLGMPAASAPAGITRLGLALPGAGVRGGPVFDAGGRLVGIALGRPGQAGASDQMVTVAGLRQGFGERFGVVDSEPKPRAVGADEIYERAMRTALQVLVFTP